MTKWEYKLRKARDESEIEMNLEHLGKQGWELVHVADYYSTTLYLKRPMVEEGE